MFEALSSIPSSSPLPKENVHRLYYICKALCVMYFQVVEGKGWAFWCVYVGGWYVTFYLGLRPT